jgi:transcriptional regulator of acetoin/glycerol metabolism
MVAIKKALAMAKGNKSKAAKLLGIGRATLHRKLKIL